MQLYHWHRSEALRNYRPGDIIVMAGSVEEARAKARRAAGPMWAEHHHGNIPLALLNEDDIDDWREFRAKLDLDLEMEPLVVESGSVFILGSD